ncbi:MarR family transcriptional regulator [Clostridiales bacterium PH28_bin88]|nr:MarR family transcriptional regulator [Clostridiales bacterium PH28_bin88]
MIFIFDIEESLGFLLAKNHQRAASLFREALEPYDITPPQFATLAILWRQDGLSQTKLCSLANMDRTTLGGIIDRLEKQELAVRKDDPEDRRTYLIYLTPKGKDLQNILSQVAEKTNKTISANLTLAEKEQLVKLLKKMRVQKRRPIN